MLESNLCDYSDAYILGSETITIKEAAIDDNVNKQMEKIKEL